MTFAETVLDDRFQCLRALLRKVDDAVAAQGRDNVREALEPAAGFKGRLVQRKLGSRYWIGVARPKRRRRSEVQGFVVNIDGRAGDGMP